ncbi:MAG: hypothetical protein AUH11_05100 [Acidobacteria bacterium 13_2_20CM_57_17]|nr:MAG: hypothetical protein AUH11_05100 [Acidobacteria bacterium 13_2_20CM_57_17]OLE17145.1 MAG: hypothetical protein AUG83_00255 [Acidobacteria bacterium 13_1_20CM_4_57_11]
MTIHGRWGGVGLLGLVGFGGGRVEVVGVAFDGIADGLAPAVGAESVDVFVLRDVDGLHESLGQVGNGAGGSGFYIATDDGGNEACQGGAEIAGGEVVAREEVGQVFAEFLRGAGAGFFLGVVEAEMGVVADTRGAATAAIRESEGTQGHAVGFICGRKTANFTCGRRTADCFERGHKSLLRVEFWMLSKKEDRLKPIPPKTRTPARVPALRTWS